MINMRWIKFLGIFSIFLLASLHATGQTTECTQRLVQAQRLYDQGRLTEIEAVLLGANKKEVNCVKNGLSKEQQATAYRLLALVYIFLDHELKAEDAIVDLLLADPEHPYDEENDPAEFIALYKKFRYQPIFRWGVFAGVNQTQVNSLADYDAFDGVDAPNRHYSDIRNEAFGDTSAISKTFDPGIGLHVGATIEYMPIENLEVVLRTKVSWQNYLVSYPLITESAIDAGSFAITELQEKQTWLSVPLALRYNYPIGDGNITPYVIGGISADFLLAAALEGDRQGTTTVSVSSGSDLHQFDLREKFNWTSFVGLGAKLSVKRINSLFIEGTYGLGGQNIVNGANRYASQDQNFNMAHIDNDKSINQININIGFIMSVYKPIKYSSKKLAKLAEKEERKRAKQRND